jgi:hypothetical protein
MYSFILFYLILINIFIYVFLRNSMSAPPTPIMSHLQAPPMATSSSATSLNAIPSSPVTSERKTISVTSSVDNKRSGSPQSTRASTIGSSSDGFVKPAKISHEKTVGTEKSNKQQTSSNKPLELKGWLKKQGLYKKDIYFF